MIIRLLALSMISGLIERSIGHEDRFTRTDYLRRALGTRYLYGSVHPTVSQSYLAMRVVEQMDLFERAIVATGTKTSELMTIKSPEIPFRVNGVQYYWDHVYVPMGCGTQQYNGPQHRQRPPDDIVQFILSNNTDLGDDSDLIELEDAETTKTTIKPSTIEIAKETTTSTKATSTSTKTIGIETGPTSTTSSSSTSTRTSATKSIHQDEASSIFSFLELVADTVHNNTEPSKGRRGVREIPISTSSSARKTTFPPSKFIPPLNITAIEPCPDRKSVPNYCRRPLDRSDLHDPFNTISYSNGTKISELAWRCPPELQCCEWECCEKIGKERHMRIKIWPIVIGVVFTLLLVCLCCFFFNKAKDSRDEARRVARESELQGYAMTSTFQPPPPIDRDDVEQPVQIRIPRLQNVHDHHHTTTHIEHNVEQRRTSHDTFRKQSRVGITNPAFDER